MRRSALAILVCAIVPSPLWAQEAVRLPRTDVTASTGWIGANYPSTPTYGRWLGSLFGGVSVGRYWTDHLKTEVEAGWLSAVKSQNYDAVPVGADRVFVESDYVMKDLRLSLSQSFQFGRNAWVHPFLGAGVDIDYLRSTENRSPQQGFVYTGSQSRSVFVPGAQEHETSLRAVPFAKGGAKFYVSDRAFIVQEFKFGIADGLDHFLWKTGFGIDF